MAMRSAVGKATASAALVGMLCASLAEARLGGTNATLAGMANATFSGRTDATPAIPEQGGWSFVEDLAKADAMLLESAFARGGRARSPEYWRNPTSLMAAVRHNVTTSTYGYEHLATTTRYLDTCCASCGKMDTAALVAGTNYFAVASAQAMQNMFGGRSGECCWCGQAGPGCGQGTGTVGMGCSACAKGRFIKKLPYDAPVGAGGGLFEKEFNIVVADICPHKGNEAWCPERAGEQNTFGSKNHFDWASPPPGFDNYYFAFTPMPCSPEISQRFHSRSKCSR